MMQFVQAFSATIRFMCIYLQLETLEDLCDKSE